MSLPLVIATDEYSIEKVLEEKIIDNDFSTINLKSISLPIDVYCYFGKGLTTKIYGKLKTVSPDIIIQVKSTNKESIDLVQDYTVDSPVEKKLRESVHPGIYEWKFTHNKLPIAILF